MHDTIFALSSGLIPAAIAILRISGPHIPLVAERMVGALPAPRRAVLRHIRHPETGDVLDEGLVLFFPAEGSVTGEPLLELHCHGGRAVVRAVEEALAMMQGVRPAEAGEFTRRAFLHGRMDLAQVEGLGDLLIAETDAQRRSAQAMIGGALTRDIADWEGRALRIAAQIEAMLDFSDEGDVQGEAEARSHIEEAIAGLATDLERALARPRSDRLKQGVRVVIAGPPNAGKSSLFNLLAGREAAIVSAMPGTTRDVIEAPINLDGLPVTLVDCAGLREADDTIEAIGIARAEAEAAHADILLWMGERQDAPSGTAALLCLSGKSDLGTSARGDLSISALSGEGIEALRRWLVDHARSLLPAVGDYALSARQAGVIADAHRALLEAAMLHDELLIAENLRRVLEAFFALTGRTSTEAMLDTLFAGFCIGK